MRPQHVLMHSPSVGAITWEPVAVALREAGHDVVVPDLAGFIEAGPPFWRAVVDRMAASLSGVPADRPLLLAGHSNAGLFLPAVAAAVEPRVCALLFVDATVPPLGGGEVEIAPPEFIDQLRAMADGGVLPPWSSWWSPEDVAGLYPDPATRERATAAEPRLPIAYYEERVPVQSGWHARRCGYLLFGAPYEDHAEAARARGWPVRQVTGEHLHMLVAPAEVAAAVAELSALLLR